jgi:hypothetical protein
MVNPEAESAELAQRSRELTELLDASTPIVDRSGISEALSESRRLSAAAKDARAEVSKRLAKGMSAGCPLGPHGPIRRVKSLLNGRDADPYLRGRLAVTPELERYHLQRRDVLGPAVRSAYAEAGERFDSHLALMAAARGHLAVLHARECFADEGGRELAAALARFSDAAGVLRAGMREADEIEARAHSALDEMASAPLAAALEAQEGPTAALAVHQWTNAVKSAVMHGALPVDAESGVALESKPGEPEPVAGRKNPPSYKKNPVYRGPHSGPWGP